MVADRNKNSYAHAGFEQIADALLFPIFHAASYCLPVFLRNELGNNDTVSVLDAVLFSKSVRHPLALRLAVFDAIWRCDDFTVSISWLIDGHPIPFGHRHALNDAFSFWYSQPVTVFGLESLSDTDDLEIVEGVELTLLDTEQLRNADADSDACPLQHCHRTCILVELAERQPC
jgi:hypothetical protein